MNYSMYYILGAVVVVYLLTSISNRRKSKDRKSRRFMDGYSHKEEKQDK